MADYVLEGAKWGSAALGSPGGKVTWAIDGTIPANFVSYISAAFTEWSSYATIKFVQVASAATANIVFTLGMIDGIDNTLGQATEIYSQGVFQSTAVTFDSSESWHAAGNQIVSNGGTSLLTVALHEIGHVIGLDHYNGAPAVMNAAIDPNITDLTQSDIHGVQALYGTIEDLFGTMVHDVKSPGGAVYALYDAILDRTPDTLGLESWMSFIEHGASLRDVAAGILGSAEARAHIDASSNRAFVEDLYQTALDRHSDPAGLQAWTKQLDSGVSRADVALGIALSTENILGMQTSLNTGVFVPDPEASNVARLYYGILGRAPDAAGLAAWTGLADNGSFSFKEMAQAFLNSAEYKSAHAGLSNTQFVDTLYFNALGRHAEPAGLQAWIDTLAHGASRADVALAISESPEAQQHLLPSIEKGWHLA